MPVRANCVKKKKMEKTGALMFFRENGSAAELDRRRTRFQPEGRTPMDSVVLRSEPDAAEE